MPSTAAGLPEYSAPPSSRFSPSYTAVPNPNESQLALNPHPGPNRQLRSFVKQTKSNNVTLRLVDQDPAEFPVYGFGASLRGTVEITKTDGVTSVEAQVEGILKLDEVAEGGASTQTLFSTTSILWVKNRTQDSPCPNALRFSFSLPTTYSDGDKTYSLPPSYEAHLSGLPGFRAHVGYSLRVTVIKPNDVSNMVRSTIFRKDDWTVSTPFLYLPRNRPSVSIPASLVAAAASNGFRETPQWKMFSSVITPNRRGVQDVVVKLYIPATRIFCLRQPIPFHLSFHSDSKSLHAFSPLAPPTGLTAPKRQATRIQLMRQTTVDVRNDIVFGTKADIWRVDCIGEGAFRNTGNGANWKAFSGDIFISDEIRVGGFRASGFFIRDFLVLTVTPPEPSKSAFKELRTVVPIRLATDRWAENGTDLSAFGPPSISSSEELDVAPVLSYTPN